MLLRLKQPKTRANLTLPSRLHRLAQSAQRIPNTRLYTMAQGYRVKGVDALKLVDGYMQEVELEGLHDSKVLLIKSDGKLRATGSKCTHYGAPLKNGVLTADGRLTCPWHGACFNVKSGDVEDAPALDPIASFDVVEQNGAVYVTGDESTIKSGRKTLDGTCSIRNKDRILVVGGGSATIGVMEELRRCGFEGSITVLSMESQPYDRTKLSKALVADRSSLAWRTSEFYQKLSINIQQEEVVSVDFAAQLVKIRSGNTFSYTTLILATGGKPRSLPLDGLKEGDFENVFLLRSIEHVDAINAALGDRGSKKVVVIGSSFIGMEVANCLAGQNHEVSVVGMESEPCEAVFGTKLGAVFRSLLEKNGVRFHMAAQVSHASPSMSDPRTVGSVHLKDGQVLPADIVIEGVGVVPATQFLQGSKDGPPLEQDGSILVDENFRIPNLHNVYAIGDIATYPYRGNNVRIEHWNVAQNMGRQVARHISSKAVKNFTPIFWSALGMQLRYCGNISGGYEDVIIQGTTDVTDSTQPSFAAYFYRGNEILAVATMGKDPIMSKSAEAMRRGCMLSRQDIEAGRDILSLKI